MRNLKILFSSFTVAFAILGLTKALSYDITMPITFLFLAITMLINAAESKQSGEKKSALCFLLLGIFLLVITAYNTVSRFI